MVSLRDQTILALRQQVAELAKERDEARAFGTLHMDRATRLETERDEAQRWKTYWAEHYDQCCRDITTLIRERDEARAQQAKWEELQDYWEARALTAESERDEARAELYKAITAEVERDRLRALLRTALTLFDDRQGGPCIEDTTCGHEDCEWYRRVAAALEGRDG